jgi:3-oxoacyl-[acyl-carrier protein] reductase
MTPVALVTGSTRGIGLAVAESLARRGFSIAINGSRMEDAMRDAVARMSHLGARVFPAPADISDIAQHGSMLEQIEAELGPLTTLVNNAGVGVLKRGDLLDVSPESWDRCFAVNSKAVFFLSQAFARLLLGRPRNPQAVHCIVNVTSANATAASIARAEYCASKAAAAMVSKTFAARLAAEGIAVFDVQPGLIATDMTAPVIDSYAERVAGGLTLIPRVGRAEEIGELVATLATGGLPYTTGQVISADGGLLLQRF